MQDSSGQRQASQPLRDSKGGVSRKASFKCPACGAYKSIDTADLPAESDHLRLQCSCGHSFRARFVQKKFHTLAHPLMGYYQHPTRDTIAGHVQVDKIAHSGIKFTTQRPPQFGSGDLVDLAVTLETAPPRVMSLEVRISSINQTRVSGVFPVPLPEDMDLDALIQAPLPSRVLVLEATLGKAAALEEHLTPEYAVQAATSAGEALERLRHGQPVGALLVRSVFLLPDSQQSRQILEECEQKNIPILALLDPAEADAADRDVRSQLLAAGASQTLETLEPPLDKKTVQSALKSLYESQQGQGRLANMAASFARQTLELSNRAKWLENASNELLRATNNILEANEKTVRASDNRSAVLAELSHEMRNGLSIISGMSDLAIKRTKAGTLQKYLETIHKESETLLQLLGSAMDLSTMEPEQPELEDFEFDLRSLVKDVAQAYSLYAQRKGLNFKFAVDKAVPEHLRGDGLRLRQILANLVSNACKFTDEGEVAIRVKPTPPPDDQFQPDNAITLQFTVSDTGPGIPAKQQKNLFAGKPAPSLAENASFGDSGLGLGITKRLVDLMGGDITFTSSPNKGTSFIFTVTFLAHQTPSAAPVIASAPKGPEKLPDLRVLVVVPDKLNQEMLVDLLEDDGHSVTAAESSKVALELLARSSFDIAIVDGELSKKEQNLTPKTIRSPKSQVLDHELPLLVICTWTTEEELNSFLNAGFSDYIPKPLSWPTIRAAMARNLRSGEEPPAKPVQQPAKPEPQTVPQTIPKPESKPEPKPEPKLEPKQESKQESKPRPTPKTETPASNKKSPAPAVNQPAEMPGLDIEDALNRLQGRSDRFQHYLKTFQENHSDDVTAIQAAIQQNSLERARQLCNNLASAANDISAYDVAHAAREVESLLDENSQEQALKAIKPLHEALSAVLRGLNTPDTAQPQTAPQSTPRPKSGKHRTPVHKARVLLVEDNKSSLELIKQTLENEGFIVYPAHGGADALQLAQTKNLDLVLLDIQMPNMSGYQVSTVLRKLPALTRTPIVAITAYNAQGVWDRCLVAGMDLLLEKPLNEKKLRAALGKWIDFSGAAPVQQSQDEPAETAQKPAEQIAASQDASQTSNNGDTEDADAWDELAEIAPQVPAEEPLNTPALKAPAAKSSKQTIPAAQTWPDLPGIDTSQVMERVNSQFGLFKRFLRAFYNRHEPDLQKLQEALEHNDTASLRALAGALLSAAANISATTLLDKAKAVERLSGRETPETVTTFVTDLENSLQLVLEGIRPHLD